MSSENRNDSSTWLLEEYKLLSSHYFHEDTIFWKGMAFYSSVNGGLLVFLGSSFVTTETFIQYLIPIIGIVLCISWISSLIRIREYKEYIVNRIKNIELQLHSEWNNVSIMPAGIRSFIDWEESKSTTFWFDKVYNYFRKFPSSISLLFLPATFLIAWIVVLLLKLT